MVSPATLSTLHTHLKSNAFQLYVPDLNYCGADDVPDLVENFEEASK